MTLFLQNRGWILDLVKRTTGTRARRQIPGSPAMGDLEVGQEVHGVGLKMVFEGDACVPEIVGEDKLSGHHNYFLGDESRWRTGVPLYGSVHYKNLYPGIDVRLRDVDGVLEYDVLLAPHADLSCVNMRVEGSRRLSIADDGALLVGTALGTLTQPRPMTWEVDENGSKHEIACSFVLLGADRFGFAAPDWDRTTRLMIDPGLIWSTFLGGNYLQSAESVHVDGRGVVTTTGETGATNFPTTTGAYSTVYGGGGLNGADVFVTRLDPSKVGSAQLIFSSFFGGRAYESGLASHVDANGVITVGGHTQSSDFPTTSGAYDTTILPSDSDGFIFQLDPRKSGKAQLVYSTFLGGSAAEGLYGLAVDSRGVVTVTGYTSSSDFPTTAGAYSRSFNGGPSDGFVSRVDPSKKGSAQLVYSTYIGGNAIEFSNAVSVDGKGILTVAGSTESKNFPTSAGAFGPTHSGGTAPQISEAFVTCLDPSKTGTAQLVYSTYLGGTGSDAASDVYAAKNGLLTVVGVTGSTNFPTTSFAFSRTLGGGSSADAFVSRLDPTKQGKQQLVYSTFFGGSSYDTSSALAVDALGVVTIAGWTSSNNLPTTKGAYDTTFSGQASIYYDAFVTRLDPSQKSSLQLVYSTFLGNRPQRTSGGNFAVAVDADASGVVTVAGATDSINFPTTPSAFDTTYNGVNRNAFVSRLDMGVSLWADRHEIVLNNSGTQKLSINAGKLHAGRTYWLLGSATGTKPGVTIGPINVPLNPDPYLGLTIANKNSTIWNKTFGTLDANGQATATLNVPKVTGVPSFTLHHAYVVFGKGGNLLMASQSVPLLLK